MKLVIIRESDNETFELADFPYGPFVLDPSTLIPGGTALDVSGYEFSGKDGGYQTSGRLQRRPFTALFSIREEFTTTLGLFQLIQQATGFFIPKNDDLTPKYFTIEVYTGDRADSSYQMRHGSISVPFNAKTYNNSSKADAQVSFIFGDPYLYPIGDSGLEFRLFAGGQAETLDGRQWDDTNGAMWDDTVGKIWTTAGGSGDSVAVDVSTLVSVPVAIETNGTLVSPQIYNLTNGSSFQYSGTLGALDVLTVDVNGTVLVNGLPPVSPYSGSLTAINGTNTFAMIAAGGSPGYADLTIIGAF